MAASDDGFENIRREITAKPPDYKPKKIDDEGWARDVGTGVLIVVASVAVLIALGRWIRDRWLQRGARMKDHELVSLTGTVRASGTPLTAPLSGIACVAHRSRAFLRVNANNPVLEDSTTFVIETKAGPVTVETTALVLDVAPERGVSKPPRERAFLEKVGIQSGHESATFDEIAVPVGAKIVVRGMLRIESDVTDAGERGYRDAGPVRMRLVASQTPATPVKIIRIWS